MWRRAAGSGPCGMECGPFAQLRQLRADPVHRGYDRRVELHACGEIEQREDRAFVERIAVARTRAERIDEVGDRDDPPRERDVAALAAGGIAAAVPFLVMVERDLGRQRVQRIARHAQDARAVERMAPDRCPLLRIQAAWFREDGLGDGKVADVVYARGVGQIVAPRQGGAERVADQRGGRADAQAVLERFTAPARGGKREPGDRLALQAAHRLALAVALRDHGAQVVQHPVQLAVGVARAPRGCGLVAAGRGGAGVCGDAGEAVVIEFDRLLEEQRARSRGGVCAGVHRVTSSPAGRERRVIRRARSLA